MSTPKQRRPSYRASIANTTHAPFVLFLADRFITLSRRLTGLVPTLSVHAPSNGSSRELSGCYWYRNKPSLIQPSNRNQMRLFIGLNLPKRERRRIQSATQILREKGFPVRWIGLENFHITMKFLGEVSGEQVEPIEAAMSKVASQTRVFSIALGGFGAFPSIRSPSLIWLGIGASPELRCLNGLSASVVSSLKRGYSIRISHLLERRKGLVQVCFADSTNYSLSWIVIEN